MMYLIEQLYVWLALALVFGLVLGLLGKADRED